MSTQDAQADIGIIGGTGFYSFLAHPEKVVVDTPFGHPTAAVSIGELAGRRVAFLPRHGERHQFAPHLVNYRANLWALRALGVRQLVGPCAVGSLRPELGPGTFVVPDQVVDRTTGRRHTLYDSEGPVAHVSFADPYCARGRAAVLAGHLENASAAPEPAIAGAGTLVVVNGPRFSSRAESVWHASQGWSIVGMTGLPEAALARELAMCYTSIAMVTDHDAGIEGAGAVTHAEVLKIFSSNIDRLKSLLLRTIERLPAPEPDASAVCGCRRALDGLKLPFELP